MSFLQNLLNFYITKYLKQEFDDNLSIWVDKPSSCGRCNWRYKDLTMSYDQKVMALLSPALSTSIMELLWLPKFDNSTSSVTRDKEICHYRLRRSTQRNPFNDVYVLSKFDVSSLRTLKIKKRKKHFGYPYLYFFAVEIFLEFLEACFNFNLITVCTSYCKRKNYGFLKEIARHHRPTWWVACEFSHVYSLWISRQGVRLSHALVFHIPKPALVFKTIR